MSKSLTGLVLSGGGSRRMGQDKALLPLGDATLLAHAVGLVQPLCDPVYIVSSHETHVVARATRISDVWPDAGPLGGILSGLLEMETDWALVLACDMPRLNPDLLTTLLREAHFSVHHQVIFFQESSRWQPLCGLYAKAAIPILQQAVSSGDLRMMEIIPRLNPQIISVNANLRGWFPGVFDNWNSPDDIQFKAEAKP